MDYEVYFSDTGGTKTIAEYTKNCFKNITLELDPTVSRSIDVRGSSYSSDTISYSNFTTGITIDGNKHDIFLTLDANTSNKMRLDYMKLTYTTLDGTSCSKGIEVTQNPKQPTPSSYTKRLVLYDAVYSGNKLKSVNCDDAYWVQRSDGYLTDITAPKYAIVGDCAYDFRQDVFSGYTNLEWVDVTNRTNKFIIGDRAFKDCGKLYYIYSLSNRISTIGEEAFANCTSLEHVGLDGCKSIGNKAFYNCTTLNNAQVTYSANDFRVGDEAFRNSGIWRFSAECNLKSLGHKVFKGCTNLRDITILCINDGVPIPETYTDTFEGIPFGCKIYVRPNRVDEFKAAWPEVKNKIFPGNIPH